MNLIIGAPPKVLRVSASTAQYNDAVTNEVVRHILLTCLVRDHESHNTSVRFLYSEDGRLYSEITDDAFYVRQYYERETGYRVKGRKSQTTNKSLQILIPSSTVGPLTYVRFVSPPICVTNPTS